MADQRVGLPPRPIELLGVPVDVKALEFGEADGLPIRLLLTRRVAATRDLEREALGELARVGDWDRDRRPEREPARAAAAIDELPRPRAGWEDGEGEPGLHIPNEEAPAQRRRDRLHRAIRQPPAIGTRHWLGPPWQPPGQLSRCFELATGQLSSRSS
jgi:hypothetical protein